MVDIVKRRIGLALGGGVARGLAHIGVLKVLHQEGIEISAYAGTSAGSIVAALAAAGLSWQQMQAAVAGVSWRDLTAFSPGLPMMGLVSADRLEAFITALVGEKRIEDLSTPFAAMAVDITDGSLVTLDSGSLAAAVRASCSIPGIFEPAEVGGRLLVDGSLLNDVPADVARALGADAVIGVSLSPDRAQTAQRPQNILQVLAASFQIVINPKVRQKGIQGADVLIEPVVADIGYHELDRAQELIQRGEAAASARLSELRRLIRRGARR